MKDRRLIAVTLIYSVFFSMLIAQGQESDPDTLIQRENAVRVFIDCFHCDMNFIRDEIPYVNYVRDVREAQLYVREPSETAGSGGRKYTYVFAGQMEFEGKNDTLSYTSRPDDTRDLRRIWRTQMLKMGFMSYVAKTPLFAEVIIEPSERVEKAEVVDRWNNWVFELEAEPDFEGEESLQELSLRSSVSATKITHDWKLEIDFDHRYTRTKYIYDDTLYTNELPGSGCVGSQKPGRALVGGPQDRSSFFIL